MIKTVQSLFKTESKFGPPLPPNEYSHSTNVEEKKTVQFVLRRICLHRVMGEDNVNKLGS